MRFKTRVTCLLLGCGTFTLILCVIFLLPTTPRRSDLPTIYAITPTYDHLTQKAELVRLSSMLKHIENFFWIIIEDKISKSEWLEDFLLESGLQYVHLNAHTPDSFRPEPGKPRWMYPRGIEQRNAGLNWLRMNRIDEGVLFFMDDDNVYDPQVFDEMRTTERVSIWPVGFSGDALVESPVVSEEGKIVGFIGGFGRYRRFPVDMAGFAVNLEYVTDSDVSFIRYNQVGVQETKFLENLGFLVEDLEPKGDLCTRVLAWHTKTDTPTIKYNVDWQGGRV